MVIILISITLFSLAMMTATLILAHYKLRKMEQDYEKWVKEGKREIDKAESAMGEALKMKAEYDMAGEALKGEDYFD